MEAQSDPIPRAGSVARSGSRHVLRRGIHETPTTGLHQIHHPGLLRLPGGFVYRPSVGVCRCLGLAGR